MTPQVIHLSECDKVMFSTRIPTYCLPKENKQKQKQQRKKKKKKKKRRFQQNQQFFSAVKDIQKIRLFRYYAEKDKMVFEQNCHRQYRNLFLISMVSRHFCSVFNYHQIQNCKFYDRVLLIF